jgi:uncharacterized metal-binding protein
LAALGIRISRYGLQVLVGLDDSDAIELVSDIVKAGKKIREYAIKEKERRKDALRRS